MSLDRIIYVGLLVLSVLLAPVLYIWRSMVARIEQNTKELEKKADKEEVKEKFDILSEDIKEVRDRIEKIYSYLINDK